jgi:hypothetical protein
MRVATFVAVLAAHVMLLWLFPSLRRLVVPPVADEVAVTPIFLPPLSEPAIEVPLVPEEPRALQEAERLAQEPRQGATPQVTPAAESTPAPQATPAPAATSEFDSQLSSLLGPPSPAPDWRAQAELTAQTTALQIVEAEDAAARRAAALTARFKPLPGPRVRGPEFGWDYAHTHRVTHAEGGGLLIALNDRCTIFIFLLPMIGCLFRRPTVLGHRSATCLNVFPCAAIERAASAMRRSCAVG